MALALPSIKGATVDVTTFQGTGMDPLAVPQQLLGDARVAQYLADVANKYEWDADAQATVVVKPEQGVLHLDKANGLMKADIFGGTDAYCDVYWNDALVGKTPVVEDSQSPEFDAAFRVQVFLREENTLRIEVFDCDDSAYDSDPDFLGQVVLSGLGREALPSSSTSYPLNKALDKEVITHTATATISNNYNASVGGYVFLHYATVEEVERRRRATLKPAISKGLGVYRSPTRALDFSFAMLEDFGPLFAEIMERRELLPWAEARAEMPWEKPGGGGGGGGVGQTAGRKSADPPGSGNAKRRSLARSKSSVSPEPLPRTQGLQPISELRSVSDPQLGSRSTMLLREGAGRGQPPGSALLMTKLSNFNQSFRGPRSRPSYTTEVKRRLGRSRRVQLQDGASVETSSAIVDTLKLAHNQLTSLAGLADAVRPLVFMRSLRTLRWLDLSFNQLVEIPRDALAELPALSICYLHSNRFPSLAALGGLRPLVRLKKLTLHGSPLADVPNGLAMVKYRRSVMQLVPWIKELDFTAVTAADRSKKDAQGQNKRVEAMLSRLKLAEAATGAREEELAAQEEDTSPFGSVMAGGGGGGDADGSPTGSPRTGARALKAASKRKKKKAADRSVEQEGRAVLKRLAEYIKAEKSNVVQIFRMFDADGSGDLDCEELQAALVAIGMDSVSRRQVRSMISVVDEDGDGAVDVSELLKAIRSVSGGSRKNSAVEEDEDEEDEGEGVFSMEDMKKVSLMRQEGKLPPLLAV